MSSTLRTRRCAGALAGGVCAASALALVLGSASPASALVRRLDVATTSTANGQGTSSPSTSVPSPSPSTSTPSTSRPPSTSAPSTSTPSTAPAAGRQAGSCTPARLSALQSAVGVQLTNRVNQLNQLIATVSASTTLTPGDKATLSTDLANEMSGITGLQGQVQGATTCAAVNREGRAMVIDFRVYVVMTPQVHITVTADTASNMVAQLTAIEPEMQAAIAAAQAQGKNVTAAQAAFADLQTQVSTASNDSSGIVATELAFTPASYPACWSTFKTERTQLQAGAKALRAADRDVHTILNDLK